ncbi:hypothetical protein EDB85DRAFT_1892443 [Lactarius pseudohatsudake]|nr:hypothetical protein EDB85DRAFT_1892443 [Lactarius pseudohatsudake]
MLVPSSDKDRVSQQPLSRNSEAGPSEAPPPSFEESVGHLVIDIDKFPEPFPEGGEDPPEFTPYEAEHWMSKNGEIISHDSHLNEDGEALYRFLLSQAETPPTFLIHCRGTHNEKRPRRVEKTDSEGHKYTDTVYDTKTITDFDFTIKHRVPAPRATQWTVGDNEPTYRGSMSQEVGPPGEAIGADSARVNSFEAWQAERRLRGLPPWVAKGRLANLPIGAVGQPHHVDAPQSSWTLRQWAEDYCQSRKIFKEFVYRKVVYGWDLGTLEAAIRQAIKSTHYHGDHVEVQFQSRNSTVIVRPDTHISNSWMTFLLVITLTYPCVWLFQHLHPRGGGRWEVGGGAYSLKRWAQVPPDAAPGTVPEVQETVDGPRVLIGEREGQWFKKWEGTIKRSVIRRRVDKTMLCEPDEDIKNLPATKLDGFE